jgi:hypothetical protein
VQLERPPTARLNIRVGDKVPQRSFGNALTFDLLSRRSA